MKRKDVEDKYKWDLSYLYHDYNEWLEDSKKIPKLTENLLKYKGHILDSASNLLNYYKESQNVEAIIEKMEYYAILSSRVEMNNEDNKKYSDMVNGIIAEYNAKVSFVIPELLKSDYSVILKYMEELPELKEFEYMFEEIFRVKEHMLNENEEAMISEFEMSAQNYGKSSQFLRDKEMDYGVIKTSDGEEIKLTASVLSKYARSEDREVRRQVFERECQAYEHNIDSLSTNYVGFIKNYEIISKYRKYSSFLEQKLFEKDIDMNVYNTMKKVVLSKTDAYNKFVKLYKNVLGYDDFKIYDLGAPLVKNSNKKYSVSEAKDIILDTFSIYGKEYMDVLNFAFDKKCIDFMPCEDKITGWFSAYIPYAHPVVFGNYNEKILDISSLCHELGHFVNQYLIIENQPPQYVYQSVFCAEVASLNNEIIFSNIYRNKEDDKLVKMELLANFIKTFANNFFGAARQALFEEKAHTAAKNSEPLSSEVLSKMWMDTTKEVFGDIITGHNKNGWAAIPHFFMGGGYYTFNYTTAIIAATNLAYKILNNEEGIMDKFMSFLKIGCSVPPVESLRMLGIDMTSEKTYEIAIEMFEKAIDEFYELMEN